EQLSAVTQYKLVDRVEALQYAVHKVLRVDGASRNARAVMAALQGDLLAYHLHLIRARSIEHGYQMRAELSGLTAESADVDAILPVPRPNSLGQQADSQHRMGHYLFSQVVRPGLAIGEKPEARVEQSFEIDQDRMLTRGNQVLKVEVCSLEKI